MELISIIIIVTVLIVSKELMIYYQNSKRTTVSVWRKIIDRSLSNQPVSSIIINRAVELRADNVIKVYLSRGERVNLSEVTFHLVSTTIISTYYFNNNIISVEPTVFNLTYTSMITRVVEMIKEFNPEFIHIDLISYDDMIEEIKFHRNIINDTIITETKNIRLK